jgi:hypothetical protein
MNCANKLSNAMQHYARKIKSDNVGCARAPIEYFSTAEECGESVEGVSALLRTPIPPCRARVSLHRNTVRQADSMLSEFPASPLTLPLKGRGLKAPSPLTGEGWDGGVSPKHRRSKPIPTLTLPLKGREQICGAPTNIVHSNLSPLIHQNISSSY